MGVYQTQIHGKCPWKCESSATACCNRCILELQLDFQQQNSLVQEVIEAAGHLCIFLLKFHCELNFIEFFWGAVKKCPHDNCDYTFDTLKENMPKAMASVPLLTIQQWEHQMHCRMEAYWSGLGTRDAQFQVKKFSWAAYKSHRCVSETVAWAFNWYYIWFVYMCQFGPDPNKNLTQF